MTDRPNDTLLRWLEAEFSRAGREAAARDFLWLVAFTVYLDGVHHGQARHPAGPD